MVRDGRDRIRDDDPPQKISDHLSCIDLIKVTTNQPQMESGQSTVSWGESPRRH